MDPALLAYLPMDRRHALAVGSPLPERTEGAALFADIAGFTPLTEALTLALGARRGAEELPRHLNRLYDALIGEVHRYGGSVIGFAGDAIACWFDQDTGARATACALAMQMAMRPFAALLLPSGQTISLTLKVAVAAGPMHRFLVGDPSIQCLDVLAGQTLTHLAEIGSLARKGTVLLDGQTAERLGALLQISEWQRVDESGTGVAVIAALHQPVPPTPWPPLADDLLTEAQIRPWFLPGVYARLAAGQGEFLTELRPAVALFLRFGGIDYDADPDAGQKLDAFIRWVQQILARYEGTLLQLTIGDKGSYLYAAFGAPVAHEDDAERAISAALELRHPPAEVGLASVQIGLSRGTMRTGAYGSASSRTYGVLGDEVNLAARLMQRAAPGQVLASSRVQKATHDLFRWQTLPAVQVKGKAESIPLFALLGHRPPTTIHLQEPTYTLPMVGRDAELAEIEALMEQALDGHGYLVGIMGEAGIGKSRLVAEVVRRATARGFIGHGGECQSYGTSIPYLVWQPIWRTFFGLDTTSPVAEQEQRLSQALLAIDPPLLPRLPLLAPVLNLPLADNDLTRPFDTQLRKSSREALLVDVLRAKAEQAKREGTALLLVLEDVHWLDALSHDLLEGLGHASLTLPLLIVLAYRPPDLARSQALRVTHLRHFREITLGELPPSDMERLLADKLAQLTAPVQRPAPQRLLQAIMARAQGTPFYAEELLNYLRDQQLDPWDEQILAKLELPTSLHSLVLSRIDQLSESQKITIKVASIIGRLFAFRLLLGYYPDLGTPEQVRLDLEELRRLDLTPLERPEPELLYLFKHIVTQEVAYESIAYEQRAALHEQLAKYLEGEQAESGVQQLELLAYHYDRSENLEKKREYLRRAGEAAQAAYANEAAIGYYERLLPLLTGQLQGEVLLRLGEVLQTIGRYEEAERNYQQALALSEPLSIMRCHYALGTLDENRGEYKSALEWFEQAEATDRALDAFDHLTQTLAEKGVLLCRLGEYEAGLQTLTEARDIAEGRGDLATTIKILQNMGFVQLSYRGAYQDAQVCFEKALTLAQILDDKVKISTSLHGLANLAYLQANFAQVIGYGEEILALRIAMGHKRGIAVQLFNLAQAYNAQGNHPLAKERYGESLHLFRELGDKLGSGVALSTLAELEHEIRNDLKAREMLEQALLLVRETGDKMRIAGVLVLLTGVEVALGELAKAHSLAQEAEALSLEIHDKRNVMRIGQQLGRIHWLQNSVAQAEACYLKSLRMAYELGEKVWLYENLAALTGLRLAERGVSQEIVRRCATVRAGLAQLQAKIIRQNREILENTIEVARSQLDEESFASAWAEGEAMSLEEAVAEALDER